MEALGGIRSEQETRQRIQKNILEGLTGFCRDPAGQITSLHFTTDLIVLIFGVGAMFWAFVSADCLRNDPSEGNEKVLSVLLILLTSFVGAVL